MKIAVVIVRTVKRRNKYNEIYNLHNNFANNNLGDVMKTTIIIHDDYVEILKDGYNIIERRVYEDELVIKANELVKQLKGLE